jgi:hypothetical protein
MRATDLYKKALALWGERMQTDIVIEEMSELIKAIIKDRRYHTPETSQNVREEMADVQIVLDQMKVIFGDVKMEMAEKLDRLEYIIANAEDAKRWGRRIDE